MSKQLQRLVETDPRFDELSVETSTGDGYWLYTGDGWWNPDLETHCVHEWTVREALEAAKAVEPCACHDCVQAVKQLGLADRSAGLAIQAFGDARDDVPALVDAYLAGYEDGPEPGSLGSIEELEDLLDDEPRWPTCPACGYDDATNYLGPSGPAHIYRCRSCGWVYGTDGEV